MYITSQNDTELQPDIQQDRTSNRNAVPYPFLIGIAAALGIFGLYFGLLTLTSDWNNAKMQFAEYRWWIIALSAGLGIQAALFSFLRKQMQQTHMRAAKSSMAASGGMSTAAMAACCAHYAVPLLPALGVAFSIGSGRRHSRISVPVFPIGHFIEFIRHWIYAPLDESKRNYKDTRVVDKIKRSLDMDHSNGGRSK